MSDGPRVAVTGANGRLGSAVVDALRARSVPVLPLTRAEYDLDDVGAAERLVKTTEFEVVVHCAAWTDVDECARKPALARRRNGAAALELAEACAAVGRRMVLVSTNEVFDGERRDGRGYAETDAPRPINSYGQSKLLGEELSAEAYTRVGRPTDLLVLRTAWLFGPPEPDFPRRIIAAADALAPDEALAVVVDEIGSPTYALDLAQAIVALAVEQRASGLVHVVNAGTASRLSYAQHVLARCRTRRRTRPISRRDFVRASTPPAWAVLDTSRARAFGVALRPWPEALADYLESARP